MRNENFNYSKISVFNEGEIIYEKSFKSIDWIIKIKMNLRAITKYYTLAINDFSLM